MNTAMDRAKEEAERVAEHAAVADAHTLGQVESAALGRTRERFQYILGLDDSEMFRLRVWRDDTDRSIFWGEYEGQTFRKHPMTASLQRVVDTCPDCGHPRLTTSFTDAAGWALAGDTVDHACSHSTSDWLIDSPRRAEIEAADAQLEAAVTTPEGDLMAALTRFIDARIDARLPKGNSR